MSGGHYQYKYYYIQELADDIEREFANNGKYMAPDWSRPNPEAHKIEYDHLEGANDKQRKQTLTEVKSLITDLRNCAKRAKDFEWFMSGDTGVETYLKIIKKNNEQKS